MKAMELATGKWAGILTAFGMTEYLTGKHGPCPSCGGKDRYRLIDAATGRWVCSQCRPDTGDGMALLQSFTGQSFASLAREIEAMVGDIKANPKKAKKNPAPALNRMAAESVAVTEGDPVCRYLRNRGLTGSVPKSIRYNKSVAYYQEGQLIWRYPAMISRISDRAGRRESFHVTHITDGGDKAPVAAVKKILPPMTTISGSGVYLGKVNAEMMVTEGVETGLACMQLFGGSAIAAISAGGVEKLIIPHQVRRIKIMADNDSNFRGQVAAYTLAARAQREGIDVSVIIPIDCGDWLDVLNGGQTE